MYIILIRQFNRFFSLYNVYEKQVWFYIYVGSSNTYILESIIQKALKVLKS